MNMIYLFPLTGLMWMGFVARRNPYRDGREWEIFEEYETKLKPELIKGYLKKADNNMSESLTFSSYQSQTNETAIYPYKGETVGIAYAALGAAGEAGEIAGKVSKIIRGDNNGIFTDDKKKEIGKEISDTLWFLAQLSEQLGYDMGVLAQQNLDKLRDRKNRGVLQGDGDNR